VPNAEPLEYDYLLMLERAGQEVHLVKDGIRLVKINVRQVLSAIESETDRKEKGTVINKYYSASDGGVIVGGNLSGNLISGNDNQIIQDSYNKIKSADIDPELNETLKQLAEAVGAMIKSLPEEHASEAAENFEMLATPMVLGQHRWTHQSGRECGEGRGTGSQTVKKGTFSVDSRVRIGKTAIV
jgi:hypothetical protein